MSEEEILEYLRKYVLEIGDYKIIYNGKKADTIHGKTESWTIIRNLPLFEEDKDIEFDILKALNTDTPDDIEMG